MAAGESGRSLTELLPVGGNRRGTDVRRVPGLYNRVATGGRKYVDTRAEVSSAVREERVGSCAGSKQTIHCTQPLDHRSDDHVTRVLQPSPWLSPRTREGALTMSQAFTISLFQTVPTDTSRQQHPLVQVRQTLRPDPLHAPRADQRSRLALYRFPRSRRVVPPFRTPPLRCWCWPRSSAAVRKTPCSVWLETDVSLPLNVS
jgi:hypothetical protein